MVDEQVKVATVQVQTQPVQVITVPLSNGLATAALVLGIVGFVFNFIPLFGIMVWIMAILGIVFGGVGISRAKSRGKGKGAAIAGLVLGILNIILDLALKAMFFGAAAAASTL